MPSPGRPSHLRRPPSLFHACSVPSWIRASTSAPCAILRPEASFCREISASSPSGTGPCDPRLAQDGEARLPAGIARDTGWSTVSSPSWCGPRRWMAWSASPGILRRFRRDARSRLDDYRPTAGPARQPGVPVLGGLFAGHGLTPTGTLSQLFRSPRWQCWMPIRGSLTLEPCRR
jgi:hypothetical protein